MFTVVPIYILEEIETKLDAAIQEHPEAEVDRENYRQILLNYVDEHGVIPDFRLEKRPTPTQGE